LSIPPRLTILSALALLAALAIVPIDPLGSRIQIAVEAARIVSALLLMLVWLGWGLADILLPPSWKQYRSILTPLLGVLVFMPAAYFLNFFFDMRAATLLIVAAPVPLAVWRIKRGTLLQPMLRESLTPLLGSVSLLLLALLPHLIQGSLGLLAQTADEEGYFGVARYLMAYPAGAGNPGPVAPVFNHLTPSFRAEGWGFYYLIAAGSVLSGVPPFSVNLPANYLLLALSVPAWHLFFREVFRLSRPWADAATVLYVINGLPLWFALYGYGRQMAWLALAPLVWGVLALALRERGARIMVLGGLVLGTFMLTETRLALAHLASLLVGLVVYLLAARRDKALFRELAGMAVLALFVATPVLYYFLQSYIGDGAMVSAFSAGDGGVVSMGPNVGQNFPVEQMLGLEPTELSRVPEQGKGSSWLGSLDAAFSAVSAHMVWPLLGLTVAGLVVAGRRNRLALALVSGFFVWLIATGTVLRFPYGFFKLFAIGDPLIVGFAVLGASRLWGPDREQGRSAALLRMQRNLLCGVCILVSLFFVRNTVHSVLFAAKGWGISVPAPLVRSIEDFGRVTEPGSRIYVASFPEYSIPEDTYLLREGHRLALRTKEETRMWWASRLHCLITSSLMGRDLYGTFRTEVWNWSKLLPDDGYDYYVLASDEDCRVWGLDAEDAISTAGEITLYRSPGRTRASSEHLLSERGTLRIDDGNPLLLSVGSDGIALPPATVSQIPAGQGRVRVGLLALSETVVRVTVGDSSRMLALDPGLSWYTTPTIDLPSVVRVDSTGSEPLRVVFVRLLPAGGEDLERCEDAILSSESSATTDGVEIDLWYINPMGDAKGSFASLVVPNSGLPVQKLALQTTERSDQLLLRFPIDGSGPQQIRQGSVVNTLADLKWLQGGGGLLQLRFELGHERPRITPLAIAQLSPDKSVKLLRQVTPAQHRLWGYDDRPSSKMPPVPSSLEGVLVRADSGFIYAVLDGRRRWVQEPVGEDSALGVDVLTPEQLWMIPPGLPLDMSLYELDASRGKEHHSQ